MKEKYNVKIEPLTPIHIGTGEELTPLDYLVSQKVGESKFKNPMYFKFSSDKILARLVEQKNQQQLALFENLSTSANMKDLQNFFNKNFTLDDLDYPCEITNGFLQKYKSNIGKDPLQNASVVNQLYRPEGLKTPVIPGSAIKGSIRTAVLNSILYNIPDVHYNELKTAFSQERNKKDFNTKIQKKLLNNYSDAKNDPFRAVQIGDATFSAKGSQIVGELFNVSFNEQKECLEKIKMQILAETIKGSLLGGKVTSCFNILLDNPLMKTDQIKKEISIKEIQIACNEFYKTQFSNEYKKFYQNCYENTDKIVELEKVIDEVCESKDSFVIRLGRWSQVEFVTMGSDFRMPKTSINKKTGKSKAWGTTRTLFDYNGQYLPMGWCKCTIENL